MAVDINKAKAKAQEIAAKNSKSKFQTVNWWKPAQGKNLLRLMPPWTSAEDNPNAGQFWREVYMHFKVGPNTWSGSCPATTPYGPGGVCPICQEVDRLRATGNPADSEAAKEIRAKQRIYSNIVDMSDQVYTDEDMAKWSSDEYNKDKECPFSVGQTKVQVFSYGPQIFEQLLNVLTEIVDFTDIQVGHDLMITRTGKGRDTSYNVQMLPTAKPFVPVGVKSIAEVLVDLDNILTFQEMEKMEAAITGAPVAPRAAVAAPAPQAALPPAAAATPPPAAAVAPPVEEVVEEPESEEGEEQPECFGKDDEGKWVHDPKDAECAGGTKELDGETMAFDPCPFFAECAEACAPPKPKRKSRRKAAKKPAPAEASGVDELEREMQEAISN